MATWPAAGSFGLDRKTGLGNRNGGGERGRNNRSSQGGRRTAQRAWGRPRWRESTGGDPRFQVGRRARGRRHGAPGGAWIGAEDAGVEAVPLDPSGRHGMDGGRGKLRRRRRAPLGCAREREQRARERAESEGEERGGCGASPDASGRLGGKQEVARGGARATGSSLPALAGGW